MSIQSQPKLLLAIYALLGFLALIFAALLYVNPLNFEATPPTTQTATMLTQAELMRSSGKVTEAEKLCLDALRIVEPTSDEIQKAKVYHALGLTYFQEKKSTESQDCYRKALACLDRQIDQNGEKRLTLENLRRAQQLYAEIEGSLADLLVAQSKYEEAESWYKSALEKNDQYLGPLEMQRSLTARLTNALSRAGKNSEAAKLEAETYASDFAGKDLMQETKRIQDAYETGEIDTKQKMIELRGIILCAQRKKRSVEYVDAQTALARTYLESGEPQEARKMLRPIYDFVKAQDLDREAETIWLGRARLIEAACCLALHQDKEAQKFVSMVAASNVQLMLVALQLHFKTANFRTVELKDYDRILVRLAEMAHLELCQKKKCNSETLDALASLYNALGIAYERLGELGKADHAFKEALDLAETQKNMGLQAEVSTRMARIAVKQGRFEEAQKDYERSTSIQASIKPENAQMERLIYQSIGENYAELADLCHREGNESKAISYFKQAYDCDVKHQNYMGIFAYAQFLHVNGDYKTARPMYEKALANLKTAQTVSKSFVSLMENRIQRLPVFESDPDIDALITQGKKLLSSKSEFAAQTEFRKAEKLASEKFGSESMPAAQVYRDIANCYMDAFDYKSAKPLYEHALEIAGQDKNLHFPRLNYINYCTCLSTENAIETTETAKKIITILTPIIADIETEPDGFDKPFLSRAEQLMGSAYATQKMYQQAQDHFDRAVSAAEVQVKVNPSEPIYLLLAQALVDQASNCVRLQDHLAAEASCRKALTILKKLKPNAFIVKKIQETQALLTKTESLKKV
ncbi:MAG TPA: tetratricopeptide repeat protein [Drouetiella sp.]|jgi:tetratricopeptide (TPR) repeat protein